MGGNSAYSFPPPFHQSHGHGRESGDCVELDDDDASDGDDEEDSDEEDEDDDDDDDDDDEEPKTHIIVVSDTEVEPGCPRMFRRTTEGSPSEHEEIKVVCLEHDIQETCGIDEEQKFTNIAEDIDIDCTIIPTESDPIDILDERQDGSNAVYESSELVVTDEVVPPVPDIDMYRKMSIQALKTAVLASGLSEDPSKLKKSELLQMLGAGPTSVSL
jgi:hypothetical protein